VIGDLFVDLDHKGIAESTNVIIMSDNGIDEADKVINLENYIDMNDVDKLVGEGAFVMIKAESGKNEHMFHHLMNANIKGLNVYKRQSLPFRYRIKESDMVLPIVLTADEGYDIEAPKIRGKVVPEVDDDDEGIGLSGYDPDHVTEMRGIMYAVGPDFKAAHEADPIKNVDYYNLMCKILDIRPKDNDGDMDRIEKMLKGYVGDDSDDGDGDDDDDDPEAEERGSGHASHPTSVSNILTVTAILLSFLTLLQ
jgi:ectonucleotide pyrophosphatase/phosphodiesterase family protein 6